MNKQRVFFLDHVRALACVLVILMHSPCSFEGADGFWMATASLLGLPCNGLFFMVSGYLLLPINTDTGYFLRRRFTRVLFPTLFWTCFYIGLNLYIGDSSWNELWRIIFSIPFSPQGTGWLWFMYVMMGLYIVAPLVSSWVKNASQREFRLYVFLCLVTSFFPFIGKWLEVASGINNVLYYFTGYIGYFLLGAYLKKNPLQYPFFIYLLFYTIPLVIALIGRVYGISMVTNEFSSYLSVFAISMCIAIFCIFKHFEKLFNNARICSLVTDFSKCSFGIYLIHHFVNHQIIDREYLIVKFGTLQQILISAILTIIISYGIVHVISRLPYAEYIIGYKHQK